MRSVSRVILLVVLMTMAGDPALAQEAGSLGLTIGYPASVGVLWQVSSRLGLRPEVALDVVSSTSSSTSRFGTSRTMTDSWQAGLGISALILLRRWDSTSLYVTPRYVFSTGDTTRETEDPPGLVSVSLGTTLSSGHRFSGSVGVHHTLAPRFAVFGELGLAHDRDTLDSGNDTSEFDVESRSTRTGIRSGAGIVFLF
jgi:hypothetical protein